jgi:ribulose-phosphate 3-epimerase
MRHIIAPSVLSANFGHLQSDIEMINASKAGWFHVDVMDGHFVPNISFGFPVMKALKQHATKPLDVHLMITEPDRYIEAFAKAGADVITVHYEACNHLHRTLQSIRSLGKKAGVALNPHTPVELLHDVAPMIDMVLIMSVNPGFGGQQFIEGTYDKVRRMKQMISEQSYPCLIEVDGGVNDMNAAELVDAGANVLVAGNYIFGAADPIKAIEQIA